MDAYAVPVGHRIPDPHGGPAAEVIGKELTERPGGPGRALVTLTLRDAVGTWTADLYGREEVTADSIT